MTVSFPTLGCKLNQSETEALARAFQRAGFRIVRPAEPAEVVIVNSCTVTARSDAKSRHALRRACAPSPDALVILTGCCAEVDREPLEREFEKQEVAVVGQSEKALLLGFAAATAGRPGFAELSRGGKLRVLRAHLERSGRPDPFALAAGETVFHARAFLKIQDGCDGGCAYCRVPLARGRSVSLAFDGVVEKLREVVGRGASEIVFTGVNISAYRDDGRDLVALLSFAARHSRGVRYRLSSLEPDALTPGLFEALADPAVCPHFHVSAQSGSAAVLRRMRRRYGPDQLRAGVAGLRRARPDAFIAADVIVGFPGETGAEFEETRRLLEEASINALHVFPFSPRPGTAAYALPDRVPAAAVRERVRALIARGAGMTERFLSGWRGKTIEVVLERKAGPGAWTGSSPHSLKCRVEGISPGAGRRGLLVKARVASPGRPCRVEFLETVEGRPEFAWAEHCEPSNSHYGN